MSYQLETKGKRLLVPKEDGTRGYVVLDDESSATPPPIMVVSDAAGLPVTTPKATAYVEGSHSDRANAFNRITLNLSLVTGLGLLVAGLLFTGATAAVLTGYFFAGFCAVWLISFFLHTFVSAEGSQLLETIQLWAYVRREQAERHSLYRHQYNMTEKRRPLWASVVISVILSINAMFVIYMLWGG